MFHVILCLLHVVGFEGDDTVVVTGEGNAEGAPTEARVAHAQAGFLLGGALQTFLDSRDSGVAKDLDYHEYDEHRWISKNFAYRSRPTSFAPLVTDDTRADIFQLNPLIADWREREARAGLPRAPMSSPPGILVKAEEAVRAACLAATLGAVKRAGKKRSPTRRSIRVLAAKMNGGTGSQADDEGTQFFMDEEERAMSDASNSSMPPLMSVSSNDIF